MKNQSNERKTMQIKPNNKVRISVLNEGKRYLMSEKKEKNIQQQQNKFNFIEFEKECFICTEIDLNRSNWIEFHNKKKDNEILIQFLHLPCLVEIIKNSPIPKNPISQKEFTLIELNNIRKQAQLINLFCPDSLYLDLLFRFEKKVQELIEFGNLLGVSEDIINTNQEKRKLKDTIFQFAKLNQNKTTTENRKMITQLNNELLKYVGRLETKIHKAIFVFSYVNFIFLGQFSESSLEVFL